jgi:hypothetical protein
LLIGPPRNCADDFFLVASGSLLTTVSVRVGANGYLIDQLQKLFLVSIAFKLVQRMNNLNKLFKTAVYVAEHHHSLLSFYSLEFVSDCQLEFAGHPQPALALARAVHVLRYPFRGSFQLDQVEYCRDSRSELFDDG